jgi:hypothetical protein
VNLEGYEVSSIVGSPPTPTRKSTWMARSGEEIANRFLYAPLS